MESLTEEQQEVINTLSQGHNVCMTGCGGTGKSHVIKYIPQILGSLLETRLGKKPVIHTTALTVCAGSGR